MRTFCGYWELSPMGKLAQEKVIMGSAQPVEEQIRKFSQPCLFVMYRKQVMLCLGKIDFEAQPSQFLELTDYTFLYERSVTQEQFISSAIKVDNDRLFPVSTDR